MRRITAAVLTGFIAAAVAARPEPTTGVREFKVEDAWGRDTVQFRTSAPLEEIVGTTNLITGVLRGDPSKLKATSTTARLELSVTSFKTGIGLRDTHVGNALGGEKTPQAVFVLDRVTAASADRLEPNAPVDLTAEGTLELNGIKRSVPVRARITYVPKGGPFSQLRPGNIVKLVASFDVTLADFGVKRDGPVLALQVAPTAQVTVMVLGSDASPEEAAKYREGAVEALGKAEH